MATTVTVIGARDRMLEERLRAAGLQATALPRAELQSLAHPSTVPPDILVLDLRSEQQIPSGLTPVKRQHPDLGLIIVASALDPAMMLEAMRAGVTECVTDIDRGELEAAVQRLVSLHKAPVAGSVFVFVGAKGGVGTTTAAVNIATSLSKVASTLVIDLHLAGGDAALFLGADAHFSVNDALENTHRLDAAYFRGLLARTKGGPDLLTSGDRAGTTVIDPPRVRALIDFCAHHYTYTVLDVPRSDAAVLESLDAATSIIVVANQELATVRSAGRLVKTLRQRYGPQKVTVVLSRSDRQAEIGPDDLKEAVGGPVGATFPSDYRTALKALNRGQPIVLDPKTPLASAFREFAAGLAGTALEKEAPPPTKGSGGLLGIFSGRK